MKVIVFRDLCSYCKKKTGFLFPEPTALVIQCSNCKSCWGKATAEFDR